MAKDRRRHLHVQPSRLPTGGGLLSKFPFVVALPYKSASSVVNILKSLYAMYGAPTVAFGDNQPFHSRAVQSLAETWGFWLVTSSPQFASSDGQSERVMQTVKMSNDSDNKSASSIVECTTRRRSSQVTSCKFNSRTS
jgi:hypothetical protein